MTKSSSPSFTSVLSASGLALSVALSFILTACQTTPPPRMTTPEEDAARLFEVLDVDGNGKVSREEARAGFQYLIASYDRPGSTEILAAKPGATPETAVKRKSKRRPTSQDANRAFEALFEKPTKQADGVSKEEFKKLIVKSSDNPETDPFVAFY